MNACKRAFDLFLGVSLALVFALPFAALVLLLLVVQGRPVFHISERMRTSDRSFRLIKLRSMTVAARDAGVSGGDKTGRITPCGRWLRRFRIDEIPQIVNVLRGDMSFVGPRPPLRAYVERFPGLYAAVLQARPGITGLATLVFHAHEERLLAACRSPGETDAVYARRCVPRKARLDLIYLRRQTPGLDMWLLVMTLLRALRLLPPGGRLPRRRPRRF